MFFATSKPNRNLTPSFQRSQLKQMVASPMMIVLLFYLVLEGNASTSVLQTIPALETSSVSFKTDQILLLHVFALKAW